MSVKIKHEIQADIAVSDADDIELTVIIGNAKMGGSLVRFADKPTVILAQGDVTCLSLGKGQSLRGKVLAVTTNILDSNSAPKILAQHQFTNGIPGVFKLSDNVDKTGDIFSWETHYLFK